MTQEIFEQLLKFRDIASQAGWNLDLRDVDFKEYHLGGIALFGANLSGVNLSSAKMKGVYLVNCNLRGANLSGADLRQADLTGADLSETNLSNARLEGADLTEAKLHNANLEDAHLGGADLSRAKLIHAQMNGAYLQGVNATNASMQEADLREANLRGAIIVGTSFLDAQFSKTDFVGAYFQSVTMPDGKRCHDVYEVMHALRGGEYQMIKWEYKMLTAAYPHAEHGIHIVKYVDGQEVPNWKDRSWWITQALNELGEEGWELVEVIWRQWGTTVTGVSDPVYILKRPIE